MKKNAVYMLFIIFFLFLDQISKTLVALNLKLYESRVVIPGFFNLTHVKNKGAIFGFFSHMDSFWVYALLTVASLAAFVLVAYYFIKTPSSEAFLKFSLSLILAGALGNLIDRIFRGSVIDFLDFYVKEWHWPVYNVADSCVTVGAVLLIYIFFFKKG
jgi:signal peptidase II